MSNLASSTHAVHSTAALNAVATAARVVAANDSRDRLHSIVVLGATSPIARAIAHEFARDGYRVILAARDDAHAAAIARDIEVRFETKAVPVHFDAEAFHQHQSVYDEIMEHSDGLLAGVILCFGFMESQGLAQEQPRVARRTIDVNLTAAVSMLERFALDMEKSGRGFIAAVSSVAGDRGRQSNYIYGCAKAGLSAYLQGLRNRLYRSNVPVITIKPGFVDTQMTFGSRGLFLVASPEQAARAIVRAIRRRKDVAYVPFFWRYIMAIIKAIPERQFRRMRL